MHARHGQFGGILGKLLALLLLAALAGAGWWWFLGRFALPSEEPAAPSEPTAVLDYVGRRDLGTDPFEAMERPDPKTGRTGAKVHPDYLRWFTEYGATLSARAAWRVLQQGEALPGVEGQARQAHLTYLHHAQLAEYYRARWHAAVDE